MRDHLDDYLRADEAAYLGRLGAALVPFTTYTSKTALAPTPAAPTPYYATAVSFPSGVAPLEAWRRSLAIAAGTISTAATAAQRAMPTLQLTVFARSMQAFGFQVLSPTTTATAARAFLEQRILEKTRYWASSMPAPVAAIVSSMRLALAMIPGEGPTTLTPHPEFRPGGGGIQQDSGGPPAGRREQAAATCPANASPVPGATTCACNAGFAPTAAGTCEPASSTSGGGCPANASPGAAAGTCVCNAGFAPTAAGTCEPASSTSGGGCPANASPGAAAGTCVCNAGFVIDATGSACVPPSGGGGGGASSGSSYGWLFLVGGALLLARAMR